MEEVSHQYGGGYAVWTCHIINMQYKTTKNAQELISGFFYLGKMIFYRQSYYNPDFSQLWLNPDATEIPLVC